MAGGGGGFHITIGSSPQNATDPTKPQGFSLEHDVRMIKSALLYANRATLYSTISSLMLSIMALGKLTPIQQVEFLQSIVPSLERDPEAAAKLLLGLEAYKQISSKRGLNKQEILFKAQLQGTITKTWRNVKEIAETMARDALADGVVKAMRSGLLEVHSFATQETDGMASEFFSGVAAALSDGTTYPLLDDHTGGLVEAAINEGVVTVSEHALGRGRHRGLAVHLLERLPVFDLATLDEVLDIRRELNRPLVRFREAVIGFSEQVKSAPWEEGFATEADQVFFKEVAPAVAAIEEAVEANSYMRALLRRTMAKPALPSAGSAAGSLSVVLSQLSALPAAIPQSLTVGAGLAATKVVYDAYEEWKQKQREIEQNQLFFYYRAGERLSQVTSTALPGANL